MDKSYQVVRITKGYGLFQRSRDIPRAVYYSREKADQTYRLLTQTKPGAKAKPQNLFVRPGWMLVVGDASEDSPGDLAFWLGNWSNPVPIGVDTEAERLGKLQKLQASGRAKLTVEEQMALGLPEVPAAEEEEFEEEPLPEDDFE